MKVVANLFDQLDVLINCAGVLIPFRSPAKDHNDGECASKIDHAVGSLFVQQFRMFSKCSRASKSESPLASKRMNKLTGSASEDIAIQTSSKS
jgi:hypothetical protein